MPICSAPHDGFMPLISLARRTDSVYWEIMPSIVQSMLTIEFAERLKAPQGSFCGYLNPVSDVRILTLPPIFRQRRCSSRHVPGDRVNSIYAGVSDVFKVPDDLFPPAYHGFRGNSQTIQK